MNGIDEGRSDSLALTFLRASGPALNPAGPLSHHSIFQKHPLDPSWRKQSFNPFTMRKQLKINLDISGTTE
jgi:hypothetical protein